MQSEEWSLTWWGGCPYKKRTKHQHFLCMKAPRKGSVNTHWKGGQNLTRWHTLASSSQTSSIQNCEQRNFCFQATQLMVFYYCSWNCNIFCSIPSLASGDLLAIFVIPWFIEVSAHSLPSSLYDILPVCACVLIFLYFRKSSHIGWGAHSTSVWPHFN